METLRDILVDCDGLAATMNACLLTAFMERTGRTSDTIDVLAVGAPPPGEPPLALREIEDPGHPRVVSSRGRRDEVRGGPRTAACSSWDAGSRGGWRSRSRWTRTYDTGDWGARWCARHGSSAGGEPVWAPGLGGERP